MTKPPTKQHQIADALRRRLRDENPTAEGLSQCRPIHVSIERVAAMCGYSVYDEIPIAFCNAVITVGYDIGVVIGFGHRTVMVGADFPPT